MVLLLNGFNKLHSKLYNHFSRSESSPSLASHLQNFESEVSCFFNQLPENSNSWPESISLPWILQIFQVFPVLHRAFAKLAVNLDYPVAKCDEYFDYTLKVLDLFNCISFSLSHLAQSRLLLSHAVSLVENSPSLAIKRLKPIVVHRSFKKDFNELSERDLKKKRSEKERIIRRALVIVERIGLLICGTVISALQENGSLVKEVEEVNGAVAKLLAALIAGKNGGDEAEEMKKRLENLEKNVENLGKVVDWQFSEILAGRNQLLDSFRQ